MAYRFIKKMSQEEERFLALCKAEQLHDIMALLEEHRHDISLDTLNFGFRIASRTNNIYLAQYLIDQGANDFVRALQQACVHDSTDDMISFLLELGVNVHDDTCMKAAIFSNEINVIYKLVHAGYNNWIYALETSLIYRRTSLFTFFLSKYHPTPDEVQELGKSVCDSEILDILVNDYGLIPEP